MQPRAAMALSMLVAVVALVATGSLAQSVTTPSNGAAATSNATTTSNAIAATDSCPSVARGTFTFACDGACASYQPCIAPPAAMGTTMCQCFTASKVSASSYRNFSLLIPFDTETNASLNFAASKLQSYETLAGTWDLNAVPWVSNSYLTKVGAINMPMTATYVRIRGGDSLDAIYKGYMAKVEIDPKFLATQTQVSTLIFSNLDLAKSGNTIVAGLPSSIEELFMRNAGLTTFPLSVKALASLNSLNIDFNNIERVTPDHEMPQLTTLSVYTNKLKTFTAYYPKLQYLDLGGNKFPSVPEVVAKHTELKKLYLEDNSIEKFDQSSAVSTIEILWLSNNTLTSFDAYLPNLERLSLSGNSLTTFPTVIFSCASLSVLYISRNEQLRNVAFTNEQANFLSYLSDFTIATASLKTNCASDQKYTIKSADVTICISNGKNLTTILGPRIIAAAPAFGPNSTTLVPTPSPTKKKSSSLVVPIVAGTAGVLVLILLVVVVVKCRRKSAAGKHTATDDFTAINSEPTTTQGGSNGHLGRTSLWRDAELLSIKVSSDDIQDIRKIGSGAFADVWLVKFRGSELLASKRLRESEATLARTQDFIDEIKLVATLKHPNVVELKGVAWIRELDLQALFEFMDGGDLRTYLTNPQVPTQWSAEKLQIAIDIAEALVFVHSFAPPLVHRDLKSRNVLLRNVSSSGESGRYSHSNSINTSVRAKLTDFGVSRYRSEQNTMTTGVGTGRWLAPEVISGGGDYGPAADIFSFGVVISELDSHQLPYADVRGANGNAMSDVALLQLVATGELVPSMSTSCPPKIAALASLCCALRPVDRPTAPQLAFALRTLQKEGC